MEELRDELKHADSSRRILTGGFLIHDGFSFKVVRRWFIRKILFFSKHTKERFYFIKDISYHMYLTNGHSSSDSSDLVMVSNVYHVYRLRLD